METRCGFQSLKYLLAESLQKDCPAPALARLYKENIVTIWAERKSHDNSTADASIINRNLVWTTLGQSLPSNKMSFKLESGRYFQRSCPTQDSDATIKEEEKEWGMYEVGGARPRWDHSVTPTTKILTPWMTPSGHRVTPKNSLSEVLNREEKNPFRLRQPNCRRAAELANSSEKSKAKMAPKGPKLCFLWSLQWSLKPELT